MSEEPRTPGGDQPVVPNTLGSATPPNTLATAPAPPPEAAAGGTPGWTAGAPEPPRRAGRRRLVGIVGIVGLVAIGLLIRFAVGTAVHGIADQLALAGTPMSRLSADDRDAYLARLEAALGDRGKGLSDAEVGELVERTEADGMPRLDDAALIDHLAIQAAALDAVDDATCAAFGRSSLGSQPLSDEVTTNVVAAIPDDRIKAWVEISVRAVEASAHSTAPVPTPDPAASDAAFTALFEALPAADLERVQVVAGDTIAAPDADVCWAIRTMYGGALALQPDQKAIVARVDVSP